MTGWRIDMFRRFNAFFRILIYIYIYIYPVCTGALIECLGSAKTLIDGVQIKAIPGPGLNLGPLTQKADTLTLCYLKPWYMFFMQLYLKQIAFKAALNKRLFSAALN